MPKTEIRKILRVLDKQFDFKLGMDYVFIKNNKRRIFIVNKEFVNVDLENFNVNNIGLYVFKEEVDGIRLSIEGSQLFGAKACKNVLELKDAGDWLRGKNLEVDTNLKGYVIVKNGEDYLGCGRIVKGKLINYVPKSRRLLEIAPS